MLHLFLVLVVFFLFFTEKHIPDFKIPIICMLRTFQPVSIKKLTSVLQK